MADRRMFSKEVTDELLTLPASAQALYFHIGMRTDDDGYCNYLVVMRLTLGNREDLQHLIDAGFVYLFNDKVLLDLHFDENNQIRKDRKKESKFAKLYPLSTMCQPEVNQTTAEVSIVEVSIGKVNKEIKKEKKSSAQKDALASHLIALFNRISGKRIGIDNCAYLKLANINIKELKRTGVVKSEDIIEKFRFVFTNMKKIAEDVAEPFSKYELGTLLAKTNFFRYITYEPHVPKKPKVIEKKLSFDDLEYPFGVGALTFDSPVMLKVHIKSLEDDDKKIKFVGTLKRMTRSCKCGQVFITETSRKKCYICQENKGRADRGGVPESIKSLLGA